MSYTAEEEEADLFPALTRKERWEEKKVEGEKRKTGKGGIKEGGGRELQMEEERGGKPIIRIGKRKRRRKCLAAALSGVQQERRLPFLAFVLLISSERRPALPPNRTNLVL